MAKPRYYWREGKGASYAIADDRYVEVVDRQTGTRKVCYYWHYNPCVPGSKTAIGAQKMAEDECAILNRIEKENKARERKRRKQLDKAIDWFIDAESDDIAELFAKSIDAGSKATEIIDALIKALDRNAADLFDSTLRRPLAIRYMAQAHVLAQIRREVDNAA